MVDLDGLPLAGGRLGASYGDRALDEEGRFSAPRVYPGFPEEIWARGRGNGPWYRYSARVPADAVGPRIDLGTLYPERDRPLVAGRVLDEAGRPVAGAIVRIYDPEAKNGDGGSRFVSTDARGRFFQSWREGSSAPPRLHLTAAEGGRHARWSEVTPGDAEVELTLLAGGVVRATLALEDEFPTANLVAELEGPLRDRSAWGPRRRAPVADGGVEFSGLPEGTYTLQIHALGTKEPVASVESVQVVPGRVQDRDLTAVDDVDWRLSVADILVVDADGAPVADARAWLGAFDVDFDRYAAVASSEEGRIRIALHPGVARGSQSARATITARGYRTREVALVPGEQRVPLDPASTLTVRLGEALARERAAATIHLFQWSGLHGLARVVPERGSAKSGVLTFAVEDPGPFEPRWIEGGRSWTIDDPSDTDFVRHAQWLEVPDEGLEVRLGD